MPSHDRHNGRPEIIHALHGVTPGGDWFLLADVASSRYANHQLTRDDDPVADTAWLVVLGRRERDMISLHAQDG